MTPKMVLDFKFDAEIIKMAWGRSTRVILPLPTEIGEALATAKVKAATGTIDCHAFHLPVVNAPAIDAVFLYLEASFLRRSHLAPGMRVDVTLHPAEKAIT